MLHNNRSVYTAAEDPDNLWLAKGLHVIAGILLLSYSLSHFGFLTIRDANHSLSNTVLPFLHNRTVYLFAGLFELLTALLCFTMKGRSYTNIVILTFVAVIVWYRWAFYFTGGAYCGCLGLFGLLMHLTKSQEAIIPKITLCLLFLTTLPWIYHRAQASFRTLFRYAYIIWLFISKKCLVFWEQFT